MTETSGESSLFGVKRKPLVITSDDLEPDDCGDSLQPVKKAACPNHHWAVCCLLQAPNRQR